jgi:hypothetical protein
MTWINCSVAWQIAREMDLKKYVRPSSPRSCSVLSSDRGIMFVSLSITIFLFSPMNTWNFFKKYNIHQIYSYIKQIITQSREKAKRIKKWEGYVPDKQKGILSSATRVTTKYLEVHGEMGMCPLWPGMARVGGFPSGVKIMNNGNMSPIESGGKLWLQRHSGILRGWRHLLGTAGESKMSPRSVVFLILTRKSK